jgi:hypothetical protein
MAKDDSALPLKDKRDFQAQINQGLRDQNNLTNQYATLLQTQLKSTKDITDDMRDRASVLNTLIKNNNKNLSIDDRISNLRSKQTEVEKEIAKSRDKAGRIQKGFGPVKLAQLATDKATLDVQSRKLETQKMITDALTSGAKQMDTAFGGMGSTIVNFMTNPLTAVVALLMAFNAQQEAIADQFGAIGVTEFRQELAGASQEFVKLGYSSAEAMTTTSAIANNFGMGVSQAAGMADEVANLAKSTGTSVGDSATLVGLFTKTQGLSAEQAMNLSKSTVALAEANDVAPDKVLSDVAGNTDLFAKFAKDGGKNVMRAAVQARKLGIEISSVASAASGLLDFESSLNAEMEASIMIGRNVNLQRARELSLAGDLEGLQQELLQQVGSEAEFNELNTLQRQSLAKAMNMSVAEVQKLVAGEKELTTLQGELAQQNLENIVPESALTATAKLINDLKVVGMQLAENIGPFISQIAVGMGNFVEYLTESPNLLAVITGLLAGLAVKSMISAVGSIFTTFSQIPFGLGIPLAIGAIAGMKHLITSTKSVASAQEGGITSQEGLVNVHPQEAIVPIEKLGGFIADAMKPVKEEISNLRNDMKLYLEFGGQVAPAIGKSVVGGIESIA